MANAPIQSLTPVQIDEMLAPMWAKQANKQFQIVAKQKLIAERTELVQLVMEQKLDDRRVREARIKTPADGIQLHKRLIMAFEDLDHLKNELRLMEAESLPYENEYVRRGGWTRVFLATSSNGHAHNGQNCSTCHNGEYRTGFAWLTRYSGKPEAEIVADAGERACTTCYKSAPANAKGTKMFTPDEEEAARARAEREAARQERARQADIKGITTPEGLPLDIGRHGFKDIAKTVRTAEIKAVDALYELVREQQHSVDPEWAWFYEGGRRVTEKEQAEEAHLAWWIIRAIAAKKDLTFQEVFEAQEKKAQAKIKKIDREWAKSPQNPNRSK
jgi:hypothetical protein